MRTLTTLIIAIIAFALNAQNLDLEKGKELLEQKKYKEARMLFEKALKNNTNNSELYYLLSKADLNLKNDEQALSNASKAIELNPKQSEYYLLLGNIYTKKIQSVTAFEKLHWANKSLSCYQKAVEVNPKDVKARIHLTNYYIQAPAIAGGSIKKATEQANETLKLDKENGHLLFAQIHNYEKDFDLAIASYKNAITTNPKNADTYYKIGMIYQDQKKFNEALNYFKQAVAVNEKAYNSLYQIGRTAVFSGNNLELGISSLKKYIEIKPDGPYPGVDGAYWRLGMIYEKQEHIELAKSAYKKALEINPEDKNYKEALAALN